MTALPTFNLEQVIVRQAQSEPNNHSEESTECSLYAAWLFEWPSRFTHDHLSISRWPPLSAHRYHYIDR